LKKLDPRHFVSGKLTFTPTTGQVAGSGTESVGSLVLGNFAEDVTSQNVSMSGSFSITSTSVTLGGKTYLAQFGGIVNGIATRVRMIAFSTTCIETVTLDRN
jgi:hypothetical protein